MRSPLALVCLAACLTLPRAATASPSEFASQAASIPSSLRAQGYETLGSLSLSQFLSRARAVRVQIAADLAYGSSGSTAFRNSAHWRRGPQPEIVVNGRRWQQTSARYKPVLALHEHLGALGFEDNNFSCSSALWALAHSQQTLAREELAQIERVAQSTCRHAGGSTVVTGGGDSFNVHGKLSLIDEALAKASRATDRASREAAVNEVLSSFYRGFEMVSGKRRPAPRLSGTSQIIIHGPARIETLRVSINGTPIPQNNRDGWSYDAARDPHRVILHGRAALANRQSQQAAVAFSR